MSHQYNLILTDLTPPVSNLRMFSSSSQHVDSTPVSVKKCQEVKGNKDLCLRPVKFGTHPHYVCGIHNKKTKYPSLVTDFYSSKPKVATRIYSDEEFTREFTRYRFNYIAEEKMGGRCNFPEHLSESLIAKLICTYEEGATCTKPLTGDLMKHVGGKQFRVECKCATSKGPTSFGPNESWDELYLLKIDVSTVNCTLTRVILSNEDPIFRSIKVSEAETFGDQCLSKRRPRLGMDLLLGQIGDQYKQEIYSGSGVLTSYTDKDKLRGLLEVYEN